MRCFTPEHEKATRGGNHPAARILSKQALFSFVEQTIDTELADEFAFLRQYDDAKKAVQEIVDMPDKSIDLFIKFCLQNRGRLSATKRAKYFGKLTNGEVGKLEDVVRSAYARNFAVEE